MFGTPDIVFLIQKVEAVLLDRFPSRLQSIDCPGVNNQKIRKYVNN